MTPTPRLFTACLTLTAALHPSMAGAQGAPRQTPLPDMRVIADALGVECAYCHGAGRGSERPVTAAGKPRLDVAREMIAMTADMNARVQTATGTAGNRVTCVTCHRGVAVPRQLSDLLLEAATRDGADAAVKLYRDLRARHYGGQAYDFSENTLIAVADRLAQSRPETAVALADLNIEFFPKSVRSYLAKGIAQSRRMDTTPAAVETFRKALEIEPGNGVIQGWLLQTEPLARRVRPQ